MLYTATRLEVQKGERIRVTLFGSSWTVVAGTHVSNELEDVGFRVLSLVDVMPADPNWQQGKLDPPGFPQTLLWAELEAKDTASFQLNLTGDLYVARAWPAPLASSSSSTPPSSSTSTTPLHLYDLEAKGPAIVEGRVIAFGVAYVLAREAA